MERVEGSVEVDCPIRTVYGQWTHFEEFPRFMSGVKEIRQLDDAHMHWHAEIWGLRAPPALGLVTSHVESTMQKFKRYTERRP